jgi:hypothetical protein
MQTQVSGSQSDWDVMLWDVYDYGNSDPVSDLRCSVSLDDSHWRSTRPGSRPRLTPVLRNCQGHAGGAALPVLPDWCVIVSLITRCA